MIINTYLTHPNVCSVLGQHLWCWPSIGRTLGQHLMLTGVDIHLCYRYLCYFPVTRQMISLNSYPSWTGATTLATRVTGRITWSSLDQWKSGSACQMTRSADHRRHSGIHSFIHSFIHYQIIYHWILVLSSVKFDHWGKFGLISTSFEDLILKCTEGIVRKYHRAY